MKSKTQKTKDTQCYTKKQQRCHTCKSYKSDILEVPLSWGNGTHRVEKNKRCGIGGFAVQSAASCKLYQSR